MPQQNFIPQRLRLWFDARKKYHLSHAQIQMARELGMNPERLGKLNNHRQEPWKLPLPLFIEKLYLKRKGRPPLLVRSIEEIAKEERTKKESRKKFQSEKSNTPFPDGLSD